jgi:FkbM family methyltransferase
MLKNLSKNRYAAAFQIFLLNPLRSVTYWFDTWRGKVQTHTMRFGDVRLTIRSASPDLTVVRACLLGEFQPAMDAAGDTAECIIDAGGFIGLASILFARKYPEARVYCLEPSIENFPLAQSNCAALSNVEVLNIALGAESGERVLQDRGTGQWGYSISAADSGNHGDLEIVQVMSLCDLLEEKGEKSIDILKLDIEGAEAELFECADAWIDRCQVIAVELHERIVPGVTALYEKVTANRQELMLETAEKRVSVRTQGVV